MLSYKCRPKKSLAAAKSCIFDILPSKFKPKLAVNVILAQDRESVSPQRAQSCENLLGDGDGYQLDNRRSVVKETRQSCESLLLQEAEEPPLCLSDERRGQELDGTARRCPYLHGLVDDAAHFTQPGANVDRISGPVPPPAGACSSVESRFESGPRVGDERGRVRGESDGPPWSSVSSRVSQFEQIIQRSQSMPSLDLGSDSTACRSPLPSPSVPYMQLAKSAESLLDLPPWGKETLADVQITVHRASASGSEVEEVAAGHGEVVVSEMPSPCPDPELVCLSTLPGDICANRRPSLTTHDASQHKEPLLTTGTSFTALPRHVGPADPQPTTPRHPLPLSRNLYLLSPRPFRLKRPSPHKFRNPFALVDSASQTEVEDKAGGLLARPVALRRQPNAKPPHPTRTTSIHVVEALRRSAVTTPARDGGISGSDLSNGRHAPLGAPGPNRSRRSEVEMSPQGGPSSNSTTLGLSALSLPVFLLQHLSHPLPNLQVPACLHLYSQ